MGQANSSRERHKSGDIPPNSPGKESQAFVFDKKPNKLVYQASGDDEDFLNSKVLVIKNCLQYIILTIWIILNLQGFDLSSTPGTIEFSPILFDNNEDCNSSAEEALPKVLPTVFKWDGGGKNVHITGTFSNWKTIPMVKR